MNEQILILSYPESDWGDDLVCFRLPKECGPMRLLDELSTQQDTISPDDYDSLQDYADAVCNAAAPAPDRLNAVIRRNQGVSASMLHRNRGRSMSLCAPLLRSSTSPGLGVMPISYSSAC